MRRLITIALFILFLFWFSIGVVSLVVLLDGLIVPALLFNGLIASVLVGSLFLLILLVRSIYCSQKISHFSTKCCKGMLLLGLLAVGFVGLCPVFWGSITFWLPILVAVVLALSLLTVLVLWGLFQLKSFIENWVYTSLGDYGVVWWNVKCGHKKAGIDEEPPLKLDELKRWLYLVHDQNSSKSCLDYAYQSKVLLGKHNLVRRQGYLKGLMALYDKANMDEFGLENIELNSRQTFYLFLRRFFALDFDTNQVENFKQLIEEFGVPTQLKKEWGALREANIPTVSSEETIHMGEEKSPKDVLEDALVLHKEQPDEKDKKVEEELNQNKRVVEIQKENRNQVPSCLKHWVSKDIDLEVNHNLNHDQDQLQDYDDQMVLDEEEEKLDNLDLDHEVYENQEVQVAVDISQCVDFNKNVDMSAYSGNQYKNKLIKFAGDKPLLIEKGDTLKLFMQGKHVLKTATENFCEEDLPVGFRLLESEGKMILVYDERYRKLDSLKGESKKHIDLKTINDNRLGFGGGNYLDNQNLVKDQVCNLFKKQGHKKTFIEITNQYPEWQCRRDSHRYVLYTLKQIALLENQEDFQNKIMLFFLNFHKITIENNRYSNEVFKHGDNVLLNLGFMLKRTNFSDKAVREALLLEFDKLNNCLEDEEKKTLFITIVEFLNNNENENNYELLTVLRISLSFINFISKKKIDLTSLMLKNLMTQRYGTGGVFLLPLISEYLLHLKGDLTYINHFPRAIRCANDQLKVGYCYVHSAMQFNRPDLDGAIKDIKNPFAIDSIAFSKISFKFASHHPKKYLAIMLRYLAYNASNRKEFKRVASEIEKVLNINLKKKDPIVVNKIEKEDFNKLQSALNKLNSKLDIKRLPSKETNEQKLEEPDKPNEIHKFNQISKNFRAIYSDDNLNNLLKKLKLGDEIETRVKDWIEEINGKKDTYFLIQDGRDLKSKIKANEVNLDNIAILRELYCRIEYKWIRLEQMVLILLMLKDYLPSEKKVEEIDFKKNESQVLFNPQSALFEFGTGEGKTLVLNICACVLALGGKKVDILTHTRQDSLDLLTLGRKLAPHIKLKIAGIDSKSTDIINANILFYPVRQRALDKALYDYQLTFGDKNKALLLPGARDREMVLVNEVDMVAIDMDVNAMRITLPTDSHDKELEAFLMAFQDFFQEKLIPASKKEWVNYSHKGYGEAKYDCSNDKKVVDNIKSFQKKLFVEANNSNEYFNGISNNPYLKQCRQDKKWFDFCCRAAVNATQRLSELEDYVVQAKDESDIKVRIVHIGTTGAVEKENCLWGSGVGSYLLVFIKKKYPQFNNIKVPPLSDVVSQEFISTLIQTYQVIYGVTGTLGKGENLDMIKDQVGMQKTDLVVNMPNAKKTIQGINQDHKATWPLKPLNKNQCAKVYKRLYTFKPMIFFGEDQRDKQYSQACLTLKKARAKKLSSIVHVRSMKECRRFEQFLYSNGVKENVQIFDDNPGDRGSVTIEVALKQAKQKGMITISCAAGRAIDFKEVEVSITLCLKTKRHMRQSDARVGRNGWFGMAFHFICAEDLGLKLDEEKKVVVPKAMKDVVDKLMGSDLEKAKEDNEKKPVTPIHYLIKAWQQLEEDKILKRIKVKKPFRQFIVTVKKDFFGYCRKIKDKMKKRRLEKVWVNFSFKVELTMQTSSAFDTDILEIWDNAVDSLNLDEEKRDAQVLNELKEVKNNFQLQKIYKDNFSIQNKKNL